MSQTITNFQKGQIRFEIAPPLANHLPGKMPDKKHLNPRSHLPKRAPKIQPPNASSGLNAA
ncbi:hypothetical protein FHS27_004962 [Rhodopirellula rubra]|uniref:Uncharacterized protein n=1 Tax=Aporhodopirellula rubra TaxID=980271 RepID=A0A7W5H867_9BACT|nr:hypothetical protein [Aporhodopirellula rubra]MBB3209124.1 hypothetical protein [Aporhodopirellula rubra]